MLTSGLKLTEYTCSARLGSSRMVWKSALHYVRFCLVLALVSGHLTAEEEKLILGLHNRYRAMVSPEAADMLHMTWNDSLSVVAQGYAAQCIWEHNSAVKNKLGENLFITTGPLNVNKSIAKWFDEHKGYYFHSDTCGAGMCGHYTQMVWAKTSAVGCSSHFCRMVENLDYENATILVCNYYPPGNKEGEEPYEAGEPCSRCPEEMPECVENACAQIESVTEDSRLERWLTDFHVTEPVSSGKLPELSVATALLAGLMASSVI